MENSTDGSSARSAHSSDLARSSIAAARQSIYIESQYFTAECVGQALLARLGDPDGPEIVVVTPLGVRLCRPSEAVLDILPPQQGEFAGAGRGGRQRGGFRDGLLPDGGRHRDRPLGADRRGL